MSFTYTQVNGKKLKQNIKYDQQTNPRVRIAKYINIKYIKPASHTNFLFQTFSSVWY